MAALKWTVGALLVVMALAALAGRKSVHAEQVIAHPPEAVWAVLMDTGQYREGLAALDARLAE